MSDLLLVFDFGTSYFKAALVDASGEVLRLHRAPSPVRRDGDRSEIAPDAFTAAVREAIGSLATQSDDGLRRVRAISFATQANTFVVLDEADRPLTPFIVWDDNRATGEMPGIRLWAGGAEYVRRTGIPQLSPQLSMAKFRWLATNDPAVFHRARRICYLGDHFTRWLTGEHVTDGSVAGLSGLFDVAEWTWPAGWCGRAGVRAEWLPRVVRGGTTLGPIRAAAAGELALPRDCQFVMGCLDQHAGAIGVGNVDGLSETTGTVLATVRAAGTFDAPAGVFRGPGPSADRYYHMSFGDVSASLLEHYRNQLPARPAFDELDRAAAEATGGLALDPTLPADALRRQIGAWATAGEPAGEVVRCIYETVAAALAGQVRDLMGDERPALIRSAGGAARSRTWLQIKADVLGIPVLPPRTDEPTLLGAATLAADALGWPTFHAAVTDAPLAPRRR